jgi:colicin import membrane protein
VRKDWTISAVIHASVLAGALVSIGGAKPMDAAAPSIISVNIVADADTSELMRGKQNAPKAEKPKPLVEKVAEPKPVAEANKVVDKPEIAAAYAPQPPLPPQPKITEPKPKPAEAKPEPKPTEAEKADPKPDPIAEAIKRDEVQKPEPKHEPKKVEAKKPEPKKPDAKLQPKFDATRIAALLDKREPQRQAATGETISHAPSLGAPTGSSPKLSQSEIDALRARLRDCWSPPAGAANADKLKVPIVIRFKPDGTLAGPPEPESRPHDAYSQAMVDSAVRATIRCQPYTMLSPAKYETWKEIMVDFSLDGMFGG